MKYELETLYEAFVDSDKGCHRMHFEFYNDEGHTLCVRDAYDTEWTHHMYDESHLGIDHRTKDGTWVFRITNRTAGTWLYWKEGQCYTPHITKVPDDDKHFNNKSKMKGRHYDTLIMDDMPMGSSVSTPEDAKKATEWYERTQGIDFANPLQPKIKFTSKKEVKGKMLQLIDVIFFNRKTKEIDFRKEIVAVDMEEAYMLAAQEYGKYNSKVHMRHANCLFSFVENSKE